MEQFLILFRRVVSRQGRINAFCTWLLKTSNTYFTSPQLQIQVAVTSLWEQVPGWPDCTSDCLAFEHSTLHAAQSLAKYWFVLNFWVLESIPFFTFKVEKKKWRLKSLATGNDISDMNRHNEKVRSFLFQKCCFSMFHG